QAEDGIRDFHVTGVQTCALPISPARPTPVLLAGGVASAVQGLLRNELPTAGTVHAVMRINALHTGEMAIGHGERGACGLNFELRSEERRVGKECRCGRAAAE